MFVAEHEGRLVHADAFDGDTAICPSCGEDLFLKDGDVISTHFSHYSDTDCAYESDRHLQMKWLAAKKAEEEWGEAHVDDRYVGRFKPDVVSGSVCIEVVVTHEGDKDAKIQEYAKHGYDTLYIYDRSVVESIDWFSDWISVGHAEWYRK